MKYPAYPEYRDSEVECLGKVPEHWITSKLKHGCTKITDGSHFSPQTLDEGKTYVTVRDLNKNFIDLENAAKISDEDFQQLEKNGCRPKIGDVLFSKDGTIGKVALVEREDFVVLSSLAILSPSDVLLDSYLKYLLLSDLGIEQMKSYLIGAALRRITLDIIINLTIVLPMFQEQQSIVNFLDTKTSLIDDLIAKKEKQIELLKEKRTAIINRSVTKGLDPNVPMKDSGIDWLGEVPRHWAIKRLKYFLDFVTSGSRGWAEFYSDDGDIFIRIGNLTRDSINLDLSDIQYVAPPSGAEGERTKVQSGDLLISITAYLGSIAVIPDNLERAFVSQHVALARPKKGGNPRWLGYSLLSDHVKNQFSMEAYGGTKVQLSLDDVRELIVLEPPLSEQQIIVCYIEEAVNHIDKIATSLKSQIEKLREYRQSLISAAVTGKIDVRETVHAS